MIAVNQLKPYFNQGFIVPLAVKMPFPADPWQFFSNFESGPYSFFLDSVKSQAKTARYSFFGTEPFMIFKKENALMTLQNDSLIKKLKGDYLPVLRQIFSEFRGRKWKELPFFTGGAVGYFGYDLAWEFEKLPRIAKRDVKIPECVLLFIKSFFVFDHEKEELYLIANLIPRKGTSFETAFEEANGWIEAISRIPDCFAPTGLAMTDSQTFSIRKFKSDISKKQFKKMVLHAKELIESGDIYQANLSQRFSFGFKGDARRLYDQLRKINPSPFSSFMKLGDITVASVSPERLIKKTGIHCETRPIAGTRPRGKTAEQNQKLRQELIASSKEQAEHIMLVDLERNDLGRVCKPHSVSVTEQMELEEYSHVIHLVSNVEGILEKGKDQFDLLKAMFPGGTITGCPKIRCMEVIEELEPFSRGLYTGSIGHLDFNGDMDLNIVIRTIVLKKNQGYFQVGAGIVHDSNPESEYWETIYKGQALVEALNRLKQPK